MKDVQKAFARTVAIDADKEELHRDDDALGPVRIMPIPSLTHARVGIMSAFVYSSNVGATARYRK